MIYFHLQISEQNSSFGMTFVKWARKKMGIEIVFWGSSPFHSTSEGHNSPKAARPRLRGWHLSDRRQRRHQSWWRRRCWKARCGGGDPLGDFFGRRGRSPNQKKATCPPRHRSKAKPIHALHSELFQLYNYFWTKCDLALFPSWNFQPVRHVLHVLNVCACVAHDWKIFCNTFRQSTLYSLFDQFVWWCHSFNFGEKKPLVAANKTPRGARLVYKNIGSQTRNPGRAGHG